MGKTVMLIVDPQIDFITGALPVPGSEEAINNLANYIEAHGTEYSDIIVTADFHPFNHCSFIQNGGEWPAHCIADSVGAAIWPPLMETLSHFKDKVTVLHKGTLPDKEEYSIFKNIEGCEKLTEIIKSGDIRRVDICGLAGNICVANTLKDGIDRFNKIEFRVLPQFSPSLDGGKKLNGIISEHGLTTIL